MPQFAFRNSAGQIVDLDTVEAEFLEATGFTNMVLEYMGSRAAMFEVLCFNGITCTFRGSFNEDKFEECFNVADYSAENIEVCRDFLTGRYKFESWR